jgi:hypothetical protein
VHGYYELLEARVPALRQRTAIDVARHIAVALQVSVSGHDDVVRHPYAPQSTVQLLRRVPPVYAVRHYHEKIDVTVGARITACRGSEHDDAPRLRLCDDPADHLVDHRFQ